MANSSHTNNHCRQDTVISYTELKKHASYSDAWIALDGFVYDITGFIPRHPFGDTFRGSLGTDCSGLFSSAHIRTNVESLIKDEQYRQRQGIKIVGLLDTSTDCLYKGGDNKYLDRIVYKNLDSDDFWLDLKARVREYLVKNNESIHYSTFEGAAYLVYHLTLFIVLSYFTWVNSSIIAAVLLAFHMVCASAAMSHMVAHFGFTGNKTVNFFSQYLMDLGGYSSIEWQIAHQTHHNQPHSSLDYQTNLYAPIRIHPYLKHRKHHQYQHIYFWLGALFYHLRIFLESSYWVLTNQQFMRYSYELVAHFCAKILVISLVVYCGYLYGVWNALLLFMIYSVSYSLFAFLLLFNDHEDNHRVLALDENVNHHHHQFSWAEVQVRTSGNWYPTNWLLSFVEFHYGYFNYHIEHHLFPAFKPALLKKISPIVRDVCRKHGIPYISTTYVEVQQSFQKHLTKMGLPQPER